MKTKKKAYHQGYKATQNLKMRNFFVEEIRIASQQLFNFHLQNGAKRKVEQKRRRRDMKKRIKREEKGSQRLPRDFCKKMCQKNVSKIL